MQEVRRLPTRALDTFEVESVEALQRGDDLIIRSGHGHIRMLGALRAANQCVKCHDCDRGYLLGAFSYTLVRSER